MDKTQKRIRQWISLPKNFFQKLSRLLPSGDVSWLPHRLSFCCDDVRKELTIGPDKLQALGADPLLVPDHKDLIKRNALIDRRACQELDGILKSGVAICQGLT